MPSAARRGASDIQIDDDVVEEIGRIIGYDELPAAALAGSLPEPERDPERALAERLRDVVSGLGFNEVITYAAVAATDQSADALRIENPMSAEQDRLRNSLRPGVLRALARNRSDRRRRVAALPGRQGLAPPRRRAARRAGDARRGDDRRFHAVGAWRGQPAARLLRRQGRAGADRRGARSAHRRRGARRQRCRVWGRGDC